MFNIVKTDSFSLDNLKRRIIKFLLRATDTQTGRECAPFGVDAGPVKGMQAIYAPTQNRGESVIIGYINTNQLAAVGELHLYSTNSNGTEQFRIKLKNDGNCELGGNADNAVRFAPLKQGLQNHNTQVLAELNKISTAIAALGGIYTVGSVSVDIDNAKLTNIKTP